MTEQFLTVSRQKRLKADQWRDACHRRNQPYVLVWRRQKYADVAWSITDLTYDVGATTRAEKEAMKDNFYQLWSRLPGQETSRWFGEHYNGEACGMTFEAAEEYAAYVYNRLDSLKHRKQPRLRMIQGGRA